MICERNNDNAPKPIVLRQFTHPQQSSSVFQRAHSNISEVDGPCPFNSSQFRSTPSPSVRAPPLKKLKEKALWQASMWLCRWNLGTRARIVIDGNESPSAAGSDLARFQNFVNHWQPTSYKIVICRSPHVAMLDANK